MKAVHLRRSLVLETAERSPDSAGGFVETWQPLGEVWAEVTPLQGREVARGGAVMSQTPHRIVLRAAPAGSTMRPRPGQRLREGTRIFTILSVTERDPAARYLICLAREEVAP